MSITNPSILIRNIDNNNLLLPKYNKTLNLYNGDFFQYLLGPDHNLLVVLKGQSINEQQLKQLVFEVLQLYSYQNSNSDKTTLELREILEKVNDNYWDFRNKMSKITR